MRRPGGDEQVTRAAGAPVLKIGGNRLADVDGDRHAFVVPALAADQDLSRPPVDVLEPDRNYFLGAKAKPCHQQQQRVVAAARTIVAVDRGDQPPDLVRLQMACQGTGTWPCNPRNAERQVVASPGGCEQEAEQAAQAHCLVIEAGGPARCRLRGIEEAHDVSARDGVQVTGRRTEPMGQEALQNALARRNGLGAQPPLVAQPVAVRHAQLVKRPRPWRSRRRRRRHHAGTDEMLDEPCDVFLPLVRRAKLGADLSGTETAGLNLATEPIDRALVMADR